jgi:hypothetical protein
LPSRETKRTLARAATVACLLIIVLLAAHAFGGGQVNPFQILVLALAFGGMGFNLYFLYRWSQALARGGRKGTILLIGGVSRRFTHQQKNMKIAVLGAAGRTGRSIAR